jgi:DNA-binding transcriptional MerR regulator/effector-binding domain-containing protein
MLRHYDAIGLLRAAHVDPSTGYRSYQAAQLSRLNRIVALKDLGFTLEQVRDIIDDKINVEELRGMLRLRRAQLQSQLAADAARLVQIEARLQIIEREGVMPADEVQLKRIPAVRVAELTGVAAGFEPDSIGRVIQPLYDELCARLAQAGLTPTGSGVAYYEDAPDGGVIVHAGLPIAAELDLRADFAIVDLPEIEQAATILHRGDMENVLSTIQTLAHWIDANGYRSTGYNRELYIDTGQDRNTWTTELQEPVVAR